MISIDLGIEAEEAGTVARLYWQSFGGKLGKVLGSQKRAQKLLSEMIITSNILVARDGNANIVGFIGLKKEDRGLMSWESRAFTRHFGYVSGSLRLTLLGLLDRPFQEGVLQLDGFCVHEASRGKGVGTALMTALEKYAKEEGLYELRLDVVDYNHRARALYQRLGFIEAERQSLGILKYIFGFVHSDSMIKTISP